MNVGLYALLSLRYLVVCDRFVVLTATPFGRAPPASSNFVNLP